MEKGEKPEKNRVTSSMKPKMDAIVVNIVRDTTESRIQKKRSATYVEAPNTWLTRVTDQRKKILHQPRELRRATKENPEKESPKENDEIQEKELKFPQDQRQFRKKQQSNHRTEQSPMMRF